MSENFSHQANLFDPKYARPVIVIGVGSIGSFVTLALAKMGVEDITVIDGDTVASHNAPMSLYRGRDLARHKTEVLSEIVRDLAGVEIKTLSDFYTGQELHKATIVACVDKMSVRKNIWDNVKGRLKFDLFVDTRTAAAYTEVHAISPRLEDEQKHYESLLYPDSEAARQTCGNHGTIYVSMSVAATVSATLARFWQTGQKKLCHAMRCDILETVQL